MHVVRTLNAWRASIAKPTSASISTGTLPNWFQQQAEALVTAVKEGVDNG